MMIVNTKEEGRVTHRSITHYYKKPDTQGKEIDSNSELKKPKSVQGFEPGLPRQNAMARPLVPPPQPLFPVRLT